jgi:hypothetical protein
MKPLKISHSAVTLWQPVRGPDHKSALQANEPLDWVELLKGWRGLFRWSMRNTGFLAFRNHFFRFNGLGFDPGGSGAHPLAVERDAMPGTAKSLFMKLMD